MRPERAQGICPQSLCFDSQLPRHQLPCVLRPVIYTAALPSSLFYEMKIAVSSMSDYWGIRGNIYEISVTK